MTREEIKDRVREIILKIKSEQQKIDQVAVEYDELTKFPELKKIIVDLLTVEFDNFISSIDWVAPRPTMFRINFKNGFHFYLTYGKRSWIAQVEGKKYYLQNLPEEQRAAEAISRVLRYGEKETEPVGDENFDVGGEEPTGGEAPAEEPSGEETEA